IAGHRVAHAEMAGVQIRAFQWSAAGAGAALAGVARGAGIFVGAGGPVRFRHQRAAVAFERRIADAVIACVARAGLRSASEANAGTAFSRLRARIAVVARDAVQRRARSDDRGAIRDRTGLAGAGAEGVAADAARAEAAGALKAFEARVALALCEREEVG